MKKSLKLYCGQNQSEKKGITLQQYFEKLVLYGSGTWQFNKQIEKKLLTLEKDIWSWLALITRTMHVTNERLGEIMDRNGTIIEGYKKVCSHTKNDRSWITKKNYEMATSPKTEERQTLNFKM